MIGLGKLGLPCLLAMEKFGQHEVYGYDVSPNVIENIKNKLVPYHEEGVEQLLIQSKIKIVDDVKSLVSNCEYIFIAVQTPHEFEFEGRTPVPVERRDFSYSYLEKAIQELQFALSSESDKNPIIIVISTALPGTMRNLVLPALDKINRPYRFIYNPYFIAMGTTVNDFMNPEFILIGENQKGTSKELVDFYSNFINAPVEVMSLESAELTKVAYNSFIGLKLIFVNTLLEISEKIGTDVNEIIKALTKANKRLISPAYMTPGLGDGGGCHPRDQIAMSWLSKRLDLSADIFEFIAKTRDSQTEWVADRLTELAKKNEMEILILGIAYKPNSALEIGSPARLLEYFLVQKGNLVKISDRFVIEENLEPKTPVVAVIGCRHDYLCNINLPSGSILVDLWGHVETVNDGVKLIKLGRRIGAID
jgi:UDPglucose 6-dehydrogenase